MKNLLRSKAFWTLVASIIAALSAFFLAGCATQAKVNRSGVHIDTVRVDYIIRSRNFTAQCIHPNSILTGSTVLTNCFGTSVTMPTLSSMMVRPSRSSFRSPLSDVSQMPSTISETMVLTSATLPDYSIRTLVPSNSKRTTSYVCCSLLPFFPVISRARRGGRRKGGKPKVKNIPLGGSHL